MTSAETVEPAGGRAEGEREAVTAGRGGNADGDFPAAVPCAETV